MSWNYRLSALELPSNSTTYFSRLSPFERRLAKYRSLSFLWLRACTSSKRRPLLAHPTKSAIFIPLNHFGRYENLSSQDEDIERRSFMIFDND